MNTLLKKGILAALCLLLVACGQTETKTETNVVETKPATSVQSETPTAKGEKVKIQYWHRNSDNIGGLTIVELVTKFNASQDDIEVEAVFNAGEYQGLMQNLQAEVAAGNEPPAITMIGWSYLDYFKANFGYVEPQTVINRSFPEDAKFLDSKFDPAMLNLAKLDGEQVGLPVSVSVPILYLNKGLLEQAGITPESLTSWEAVASAAAKVKESTGKYGLYINESPDNWNVQQMIDSNGANVIKDGKAAFASDGAVSAYQLYQDMVKNGSALHVKTDEGQQAFMTGDVAMGHISIASRTNLSKNANFVVTGVPAPAFEGKELSVPAGGAFLAITAKDEVMQNAAWKFMKFLYEPENVAAWTMGTGYVPTTTDAYDNSPELKALIDSDSMMQAAYKEIPSLKPWGAFPGSSGLQAEQRLLDLRDEILGGAPVKETLERYQEEINQSL